MNLRPKFRARPSWKPKPRPKFALKAKPRSTRGILRKETHKCCGKKSSAKHSAAGQRTTKTGRRLNRIGKHWLSKPAVVNRGEQEICNPATDEGRAEYKYRTMLMWIRQDSWCCFHEYEFCPGRLKLKDATFEHQDKRTMGRQDDRISYIDKAGKERPQNGAAHGECNRIAGSRRLPIDHGTNTIYQKEKACA